MNPLKKLYDIITTPFRFVSNRKKKEESERQRYRNWIDPETEQDARAYEETLEKFKREHPDGLKLYDDDRKHRSHGREGCWGGDEFDKGW